MSPLLLTPPAWVGTIAVAEVSNPSAQSANDFAERGVSLFRDRQYARARDAFSRAYVLDPQTETLLELGISELESGRPVDAVTHLREYLARSDTPQAKIDVVRTKWLPQAEARTARLDVFVRAGAEIRVDGAVASVAPPSTQNGDKKGTPLASFLIAAGEHEVSARDGTLVQWQHVVARGGELVEAHFQRLPDAPAPPRIARTFAPGTEGGHGAASSRAKWITAVGLESAALLATGVAIGFSVAVEQDAADANALAQRIRLETGGNSGCLPPTPAAECPELSHDRQSERTNATLANGLYAAAGAFAVLGAAAFLLWPPSKETSAGALHPVPVVSDRAAGAMLVGAW